MSDDRDMGLGRIARLCDVSRTTVYRWIMNGHLRSYTLPSGQHRVRVEDLSSFCRSFGIPDPQADPELMGRYGDNDDGRSASGPLPTRAAQDRGRLRVLLADDDAEMLMLMRQAVTQHLPEAKIIECANGVETCVMIGAASPQLVLLDILMPGMDGFAVLGDLLVRAEMQNSRVVVVSAFEPFEQVADLERRHRQVVACLRKPVSLRSLGSVVREAAQGLVPSS